MAQVQAVWNKLNPRERLSAIGAGVIILAWLVGLVTYGAGAATLSFLGALAVLVDFGFESCLGQNGAKHRRVTAFRRQDQQRIV